MRNNENLCLWTQQCEYKHKCCSFCKKSSCIWRCVDDCKKCKFTADESILVEKSIEFTDAKEKDNIKTHNVRADRLVIEKLIKYKKSNKLKTNVLSKRIGVNESTLNKIMRDPISKIRSDSYNKIKEFVKTVNTADKKRLW